jgi:Major tropism determinant N-terminal domain
MANRIQLRRDTSANWATINPILADGEPGLEIDTNKIKYGDGTTVWSELDYAGAGFQYANIQEGNVGNPVTSITGIPGDGISLTSDNYSQLMWVPDTNVVTLAEINSNGPAYFSWAYVDNTGFNIENKLSSSHFQWLFSFDGTTQFPHYSFPAADGTSNQVLQTNGNGVISWGTISTVTNQLVNGSYTVALNSSGLLTVPSVIDSTAGTGAVTINSNDGATTHTWTFSDTGTLTFPDSSVQTSAYQFSTIKSAFNATGPNIQIDNAQFSYNNSGNPTVAAVSGTWSGTWTAEANVYNGSSFVSTAYGSSSATWTSIAAYGFGPTFSVGGDKVVAHFTDDTNGHIYKVTWIASSTNPTTNCTIIVEKLI